MPCRIKSLLVATLALSGCTHPPAPTADTLPPANQSPIRQEQSTQQSELARRQQLLMQQAQQHQKQPN